MSRPVRARPFALPGRAVLAGAVAAGLVLGALGLPASAATTVAPAVSSPLSATTGAMWQTDNSVSALAWGRGVLYVGGTFTKVRPPGAAGGAPTEVSQPYLAAFRTSDMSLISTWRPVLTGPGADGGDVQALELSPDGSRLYVGGDFTSINGVARSKVAAFDLTTPTAPALLGPAQFAAGVGGRVYALAATDTALYVAGTFTTAAGQPRTRVAAFGTGAGALLPWKVDLQGAFTGYTPMANSLEVGRGHVYVGGMFNTVNGVASHGLAVVDPVTGARQTGFRVPTIIPSSYLTAILLDPTGLYVAGRDSKTGDPLRLEGVMSLDPDTGAVRWGSDGHRCLGDSFALASLAGTIWVGTHAHNCSAPPLNGHPENSFPDRPVHRFYASTLGHNPATGELRHFFPDTTGSSTVPGSQNNVRAFATDGTRLFVGGGWIRVNGVLQQNLTVFSPRPALSQPTRSDPPVKVKPVPTGAGAGRVTVTWTTSTDRDDRNLTYRVYRRAETTPFFTTTVPSAFWSRQPVSVTDTGLTPGANVYYRVVVTDGDTAVPSGNSATVVVPSA